MPGKEFQDVDVNSRKARNTCSCSTTVQAPTSRIALESIDQLAGFRPPRAMTMAASPP